MSVRSSVNFSNAEMVLAREAAGRAGLKLNAWIRRAVRETAAMEAAVAKTEERQPEVRPAASWVSPAPKTFQPDFGKRLKP